MNLQYLFRDPSPEGFELFPSETALTIESGGEIILGKASLPLRNSGDRLPLVLLCHGFPGYAQNHDVAKALRHIGFVTCTFHYRGCWGSYGDYRLSHLIEDIKTVLAHLCEHSEEFFIDTDRIFLFGHSMGGFAVMNALATGARASGAILLTPVDAAQITPSLFKNSAKALCLHLDSPNVLNEELEAHREEWSSLNIAEALPRIPLLFIGALRDTIVPPQTNVVPVVEKLKSMGRDVEYRIIDDTHTISLRRIEFMQSIASWLVEKSSN